MVRENWDDRLEVFLISLTISGVDTRSVLHLNLPGVVSTPAHVSNPRFLSQFRRLCKHSCADKQNCAHSCCKEGVTPKKQSSAGFMDNINQMRSTFKDKFNNTVAGGEELGVDEF